MYIYIHHIYNTVVIKMYYSGLDIAEIGSDRIIPYLNLINGVKYVNQTSLTWNSDVKQSPLCL